MSTVIASAPGKLMLYGEHAVVYDHPCIVTAVDLRMQVSATLIDLPKISIQVPRLSAPFVADINEFANINVLPQEIRFVGIAIQRFWKHIGQTFGIIISTQSEFSQSYGLGSSSAVTVATVKALSEASKNPFDLDQIFKLSYESVLEAQQGIGSGFDVAAATYGGTIYFVTGGKEMRPIPVYDLPLVIGYTGVKAKTTKYVKKVAELRQRFPEVVDFVMESIEVVVKEAELALHKQDFEQAGQLMNFNQGLLHALGVSVYELDFLIAAARLNGAYGAKLSGAGGGDCMIVLVNGENKSKVEQAILVAREYNDVPNAEIISVKTGADGVRIDRKD